MYWNVIFLFGNWYYCCIRQSFTFQKESFRKNIIIVDTISDEKLQYVINREAAKILASPSDEIDKYEYLTRDEIRPSGQSRLIEQAKFTYSLLREAFEKQKKTVEGQGRK